MPNTADHRPGAETPSSALFTHKAPTARNTAPPSEACLQLSPNCCPSQALLASSVAAVSPLPVRREAPRRFHPRLRPAFHPGPNSGQPAALTFSAAGRLGLKTFAFCALWPFRRQRPPAPAPLRSKRPFARCARFDLERCLPFSPPADRPDLPPAFSRLRFSSWPPAPTTHTAPARFRPHDFRFHHHRPNERVSGTACFPKSIVGDATSPSNRQRCPTA